MKYITFLSGGIKMSARVRSFLSDSHYSQQAHCLVTFVRYEVQSLRLKSGLDRPRCTGKKFLLMSQFLLMAQLFFQSFRLKAQSALIFFLFFPRTINQLQISVSHRFGVRNHEFKSCLYLLPVIRIWVSYLTSQNLCALICEVLLFMITVCDN